MDAPIEVRLDALRQISERKLLKILDSISGLKDLLIDPTLMKPLERFVGVTALRKHGVEKIFRFEPGSSHIANTQRVFLAYSEASIVTQILHQIQAEKQKKSPEGRPLRHDLILVTGSYGFSAVSLLVEEHGLWGEVNLHLLNWEFLKLDDGLWSLEIPTSLKSLLIQNDLTLVKSIAKALWCVQLVLGRPGLTLAQGPLASKVLRLMNGMKWPEDVSRKRGGEGGLGGLVIVSRDVDWPSALMTPVTYTALLDQVLGVRCGHVTLPTNPLEPSSSTLSEKQLALSSQTDPIYQHIKNLHFSGVFPYLRDQTKSLQQQASISRNLTATEMKQFVKEGLGKAANTKKALANHIAACEAVVEQIGSSYESLHSAETLALLGKRGALPLIEDLLGQGQLSLSQALRLGTLFSLGGVHDEAAALKAQTLLCHGHQHLGTFHALERAGVINDIEASSSGASLVGRVASAVITKSSSLQVVAKKLKLFPTDENAASPDPKLPAQNMSYVFGGSYTPIICRLVEWLTKGEPVAQLEEALKLLPGPTLWQGRDGEPVPRPAMLPVNPKTFFVCVIGGITYAEVAAFQILEAQTKAKIIVSGTSILSKDSLASACTLR